MKNKVILSLSILLLSPLAACKSAENPSSGDNGNQAAEKEASSSAFSQEIQAKCAQYGNEQEATICASDGKTTWSLYCYDGDAYSDYSENCTAAGMGCAELEYTNGVFGVCTCTSSAQCTTNVENADPLCTTRGECSFQCHAGFHETLVKTTYEDGLYDLSYKCAEDYETPADVGAFCTGKSDGYYCLDSSSGDSWQIYCEEGLMAQGYSQNCTSYEESCGPVEENGKTYNICQESDECQLDQDCTTEVENASPWCNTETSGPHLCSFKCNDGYTDDFLTEGCELIE